MMSQPIAGDPQKRHGAPSFDWSEEAPARKAAPAPGPVALTSTWHFAQGCPPELAEALRELPDKVKAAEPETLTYIVHLNANAALDGQAEPIEPPPAPIPLDQQQSVTFYEVYATPEAFSRHVQGEVFQTFKARFLRYFKPDPSRPGWPITTNANLQRLAGFVR
jgi:quinol monooxygenase YgiN